MKYFEMEEMEGEYKSLNAASSTLCIKEERMTLLKIKKRSQGSWQLPLFMGWEGLL